MIVEVALVLAEVLVLCGCCYRIGRIHERRDMRRESGWWDGFRRGAMVQAKKIQEDMREQGLTLTLVDASTTKHN